jgi:two-component system OmpR family response regulator
LRRYKKEPVTEEKKAVFECSLEKQEVRKNGELLYLTNAEFEIMAYFIKRSGFALSREEIITNVDAISYESSTKSIDVMIGRLRHKIEEEPKRPRYLISLRGIGYKLINE